VLKVLDLFSGIGGFSLGLERAGMHTIAFCEIDAYCRRVLAKHWPGVPCYGDIRQLTGSQLRAGGITPDVLCGGFPCQDISSAGKKIGIKGVGIKGERSWLWREYARLIGEIRPKYAIVENVAALLGRGLGDVLGNLSEIGYDAEWHCIPASAVGAPHQRDRIWIVANPHKRGLPRDYRRKHEEQLTDGGKNVSHSNNNGCERSRLLKAWVHPEKAGGGKAIRSFSSSITHQWHTEPDVGRVAHGVPHRVDRVKALGNAVVPQITEIIGKAIVEAEVENARA